MTALRFAVFVLVYAWFCIPVSGQTPPEKKPLTAEQQEWRKEAKKWGDETAKLRKEGKLEEAIAAAEKMLAAEVKVHGELHDDPIGSLGQIAECREQLEQFVEAKKVREQILELQTKRFGKDDWRVIDARLAVANADLQSQLSKDQRRELLKATQLSRQGLSIYQSQQVKALPLFQEAFDIRKRVLGENHPSFILSMYNLTNLYIDMGQHAKAEAILLKAKEINRSVFGENHPNHAFYLSNLASLYNHIDQPSKAEPFYLQAKVILKKALGDNHPHYATSLNNLALLYSDMGQPAKSEPLYVQSSEIYKKVFGEYHPNYATSLSGLASLYQSMGQHAKAEPLYLQAKTIRLKVFGENHPTYATSLSKLASLYSEMGQYAKSEPLCLQANEIQLKVLGKNHLDYAASLNNLALLYSEMGQPAKAEPLYIQSKEIKLKVLGENHTDYALSLNNLAALYSGMGQPAKAEPLYIQAKEIFKKVFGENHPSYATSLNNLASSYSDMGQRAKAEPFYIQSKEIIHKALGENHPLYAASLNNLANLYSRMGQPTRAEPLYVQSKEIIHKVLGENHPAYARTLNNLADAYIGMNEPTKAEPLYQQAKEIKFKVLGENHSSYATSLNSLGMLYSDMGQPAKAEPLFLQAVSIVSGNLERTSEIQTESSQLETAKANRFYWENLLRGTAKTRSVAVYDPIFRIRGAVTSRQMFLRTVRVAKPETKPLVEELQKVSREMSRLVNSPPDAKLKVDMPKKLDELNARYEQLQRELASKSEAFAAYQKKKKATPADLQKLLPDDAVLIDYVAYKDQFCAFVVSKNAIQRFELGAISPIAAAVDRFREQLNRGTPLTGKDNDPAVVLRDKLWKPLLLAIGSAKLVLLCPDGPLCRLPFAALPGTDDKKYLIEELALATMPVPQMLFDILAPRPERKDDTNFLAMGNVDFDSADAAIVAKAPTHSRFKHPSSVEPKRSGGGGQWGELGGTAVECTSILASFRKLMPDAKTTYLEERQATAGNLRNQLGRYQFVHLATHGYFSPKELTAKVKAKEDGLRSFGENRPQAPVLNPALMSGIVCSGANKPTEENDGVLTALEISELDLSRIDLAILSACETGLGETASGEGIFGLQRAFQLAGARTTVTSLWKISDGATQQLMSRFYQNFFSEKNMGTLEALREAQLWMLKEGISRGVVRIDDNEPAKPTRSPPIFWAAFSLAGDWR